MLIEKQVVKKEEESNTSRTYIKVFTVFLKIFFLCYFRFSANEGNDNINV